MPQNALFAFVVVTCWQKHNSQRIRNHRLVKKFLFIIPLFVGTTNAKCVLKIVEFTVTEAGIVSCYLLSSYFLLSASDVCFAVVSFVIHRQVFVTETVAP